MSDSGTQPRIDIKTAWPEGYKLMRALHKGVQESGLDLKLLELIKIRASQINRCAFCINMHTVDARKLGETEQRIALLPAFEEAPCYTAAEKAALAFTESLTELPTRGVPNAVIDRLRPHFDAAQISKLVFAILLINAWNRIGVADALPFPVEAPLLPAV